MAEKSYIWTCTDIGDGGPNSFSLEVIMTWLGNVLGTFSPETSGVIPWKSTNTEIFEILGLGPVAPIGLLTPTYNSNVLSVDTGIGMTGGVFYVNTTPKTFNIPALKSGLASATDRIVLRREVLAQTARLVYIPATAPSTIAPLVQNKVFWDVPIARINLNGAGNYASFVDERSYATSPFAGKLLLHKEILPSNFALSPITRNLSVPFGYSSLELTFSGLIITEGISAKINVRFNADAGSYRSVGTVSDGTDSVPRNQSGTAIGYPIIGASQVASYSFEMIIPNYSVGGEKVGFYRSSLYNRTLSEIETDTGSWAYILTAGASFPGSINEINLDFGPFRFGGINNNSCVLSLYGIK